MTDKIDVLDDKGYVRLVDIMGSDLTVVNAARCSYLKKSDELTNKDEGLIKFLAKNSHSSPFRHVLLSFEIKAPFLVARQWAKYRIGSIHTEDTLDNNEVIFSNNGDDGGFEDPLHARNEASRRYVTLEPEWYVPKPHQWRSKPENSKQGSGYPLPDSLGVALTRALESEIKHGKRVYQEALDKNVAPEQARAFLPAVYFMYTTWYWTTSLQSVSHFLNQRLTHDAQHEITQYAQAVYELTKDKFPVSLEYLIKK